MPARGWPASHCRLCLSRVTILQNFWVRFPLKFEAKMRCWMVIALPSQRSVLCIYVSLYDVWETRVVLGASEMLCCFIMHAGWEKTSLVLSPSPVSFQPPPPPTKTFRSSNNIPEMNCSWILWLRLQALFLLWFKTCNSTTLIPTSDAYGNVLMELCIKVI